jgi:hypothetical protein
MEKTFVVTGRPRTGTSMMMRCLDLSSDIIAEYDTNNDILANRMQFSEDYSPNPNGYYLPRKNIFARDVPGGLIKMSLRRPQFLDSEIGNYKIVWMVRDEKERLNSWERAFGRKEIDSYDLLYESYESSLRDRNDCTITYINYSDVINDPILVFEQLQADGWPIDPAIAASFVDPSLYRNRVYYS